ncbi:MAG: hypothetical protein PHS32_20660 [Rhodoferax sp.]|uniref:hypothetical protein n=1 Tax=Rhodoferax sp. TaxID=50421 RepID=UPI00263441A7|nr:hypothetical protein [Rhodoferax sp.]MDD5336155.1 hypothetical protein [Rhodoferax sp.]
MSKTQYIGELAKKLPPLPKLDKSAGPLSQVFHEKEVIEAIERGIDQEFEKLPLLFEHYGIEARDHASYIRLALALARDWVPGFQRMNDRAGPKQKWDDGGRARLKIAIDDFIGNSEAGMKGGSPTKLEAAEALLCRVEWKRKSASAAALLKQAEMANPILVAIERDGAIRRARRAQELTINS